MLSIEDATTLSRVTGKVDVYRQDAGFLYAIAALRTVKSSTAKLGLQKTTYVLIKPDAFAFGKASIALQYLLSNEFIVASYRVLQLTEAQMLGLWRYQWNRATPARMAASLSIGLLGPSILVALQDTSATINRLPAAPRLWSLKGSASATGRSPDRLRSVLSVRGRYFGYVHVPDEPADVVRELAWLLGTPAMIEIITNCRLHHDCTFALQERISALERQYGLSWKPEGLIFNSTVDKDSAETSIMSGYSALYHPELNTVGREDIVEAWRRLADCSPSIIDNREGIRAIVESGDVSDPAVLWRDETEPNRSVD